MTDPESKSTGRSAHRFEVSPADIHGASVSDWLNYLKDIGWQDVYREPPMPATAEVVDARASESEAPEAEVSPADPNPADQPLPEVAVGEAATAEGRREKLMVLAEKAQGCRECSLCETRQNVVFGSGDPNAELMFIGEGPGANEDRQGLPFVGAAGELLTKIIQAIGSDRDKVYIANIVKCRPPGNRDPQPDEVRACREYLSQQIELVQPRVLVALGRVAAQTLLENNTAVGRLRGQWWMAHGIDTMVTYHPAALLRNSSLKRPLWEDMQKVRDFLAVKTSDGAS